MGLGLWMKSKHSNHKNVCDTHTSLLPYVFKFKEIKTDFWPEATTTALSVFTFEINQKSLSVHCGNKTSLLRKSR